MDAVTKSADPKKKKKMTMAEAAHRILLKNNAPLHYRELIRRALKTGMCATAGKTPEQSLRSLMATEFLKKAGKSRFRPKGDGLYDLTPFGRSTPPSECTREAQRKARLKTRRRRP